MLLAQMFRLSSLTHPIFQLPSKNRSEMRIHVGQKTPKALKISVEVSETLTELL